MTPKGKPTNRYTTKRPYIPLITTIRPEVVNPCNTYHCGINAECKEKNQAAACVCLSGLKGDPYVECKHECTTNPDCPSNKACDNNKCSDPCEDVCGAHATCSMMNYNAICKCNTGYVGDPFSACYAKPTDTYPHYPTRRPQYFTTRRSKWGSRGGMTYFNRKTSYS